MTSIGNQISFNNRSYDVDRTATPAPSSVRQNFAEKLQELSSDGSFSSEDKAQLATLGQTASEKSIVADISRVASAAFDPDAAGPMNPVQISFGNPAQAAPAQPTTPQRDPEQARHKASITAGRIPLESDISRTMASTLEASMSDNRIESNEIDALGRIATTTRTPGDAEFVGNLNNFAETQQGNNSRLTVGIDGDNKQVRVDNRVRPEGRAAGAVGSARDRLIEGGTNILVDAGLGLLRNALGVENAPATPRPTGTPVPTTQPPTTPAPATKNPK